MFVLSFVTWFSIMIIVQILLAALFLPLAVYAMSFFTPFVALTFPALILGVIGAGKSIEASFRPILWFFLPLLLTTIFWPMLLVFHEAGIFAFVVIEVGATAWAISHARDRWRHALMVGSFCVAYAGCTIHTMYLQF